MEIKYFKLFSITSIIKNLCLIIIFYSIFVKSLVLAHPLNENDTSDLIHAQNWILNNSENISFTENKGQARDQNWLPRPDVLFSGNSGELYFHIRNNGISYQLFKIISWKEEENLLFREANLLPAKVPDSISIYRTDIFWEGINDNFKIETNVPSAEYSNYYNVPEDVEPVLYVKNYNSIWFRNIYNGIDLNYYSDINGLKYDYVVQPGADHSQIKIRIEGAELELNENGDLLLITPFGIIKEGKPVAYQNGNEIFAKWIISGNLLSIDVEDYSPDEILIIDPPVRIWGTYFGGSDIDNGVNLATDIIKNVYLTGYTASTNNIITTGAHQTSYGGNSYDAFLTKFNENGTRQWSTYYGGSGIDRGFSCAVDNDENVYLTGETASTTNISTTGAHQTIHGGGVYDAFLVKFNKNGVRQWGTYYGGTGIEFGIQCSIDSNNFVYMAGRTASSGNIATTGAHQTTHGGGTWDAYIVKFNSNGVRQWGTYFGGSQNDEGMSCAVDGNNNVYLAGRTTSGNLDTLNSHQNSYGGNEDAFLAKFNSSGALLWSTYYGGSGEDLGWNCATDLNDNVYLGGRTASTNNIATTGSYQSTHGGGGTDAFLVKFDSSGVRQWATYFGSTGQEFGRYIALNNNNYAFLAGNTASTSKIASSNAHQTTYGGNTDAFLVKFNSNGKHQWSTYYGGSSQEIGLSCAVDSIGYSYLSGYTQSSNNISTNGSHQSSHGGGTWDVFLVKFHCYLIPKLNFSGSKTLCQNDSLFLYVGDHPDNIYQWFKNGDTIPNANDSSYYAIDSGFYYVKILHDSTCLVGSDTIQIILTEPLQLILSDTALCFNDTIQILSYVQGGTPNYSYIWSPSTDLSTDSISNPLAFPKNTTTYTLTVSDSNICIVIDSMTISVNELPEIQINQDKHICKGDTVQLSASGGQNYLWSPANSLSDSLNSTPFAFPATTTSYSVLVTNENACKNLATSTVYVYPFDTAAPNQPLILNTTVNDNSSITIFIENDKDSSVTHYELYVSVNDSSFTLLDVIFSLDTNFISYNHLNNSPSASRYCYYIISRDSCNVKRSQASDVHCAILLNGTPLNLSNSLRWYHYKGYSVKNYILEKWVNNVWQIIDTLSSSDSSFIDTGLLCNVPESYRVKAFPDSSYFFQYSNINIAPDATVSASSCNTGTCSNFNDQNLSTCGNQSVWITTSDPPSSTIGINYIEWEWSSQRVFDRIKLYYGQNNTRHLTGGIIQIWANNAWVSVYNFSNLVTSTGVCDAEFSFQPITAQRMRITAFEMTGPGQNSNPSFREIEIYQANLFSTSNTITLTPFDTIPPDAPELYHATVTNNNTTALSWNKSPSNDVDRYIIFRKNREGNFTIIDTVGDVNYYIDNTDASSSPYCYAIAAIDSCSENMSELSQTHCLIYLEGNPSNLSNLIKWFDYSGLSINHFDVLEISSNDTFLLLNTNDTSLIDERPCNIPVSYIIRGNLNGDSSTYSNLITLTPFDTIPPTAPELKITTVSFDTSVFLTWNKSQSNNVDRYIIYRKTQTSNFTVIDTVGDVDNYFDNSIDPSLNQYCYAVSALDSCADNESELSTSHCYILIETSTQSCEQFIELQWTSYEGWDSIVEYRLYRSINNETEVFISSFNSNQFNYEDTSVSFPNTYCYRLEAVQADLDSLVSTSSVNCNYPFEPAIPFIQSVSKLNSSETNGEIQISWENQSANPYISFSRLYFKHDTSENFSISYDSIPLSQTGYIHQGLNNKTEDHHYYMSNIDSCGNESFSSVTHKSMTITVLVGQLLHIVDWTPYIGFNLEYYLLERYVGGSYLVFDTIPPSDTNYTFTPAPCNVPIIYRISAVDESGLYISLSDTAGKVAIDSIPPDAPAIHNLSVINNNRIALDMSGADSLDIYGYSLQRSTNNNQYSEIAFFEFTSQSQSIYFEDTTADLNFKSCYVLISLDSCLNATLSDTFCHIHLTGVEENLQNTLNWTQFIGYEIDYYIIENYDDNQWIVIDTLPAIDTQYIHAPLSCNEPQTYRITGKEEIGNLTSISNYITLTPFDTIPPIPPEIYYVTVPDHNSIELEWILSDPKVLLYEIQLQTNAGNWEVFDTTNLTNKYTLSGLNTADSVYCIRIIAIDSCAANRSEPSIAHCVINLSGNPANLANELNWTNYVGFDSLLNYYVQLYENNNWIIIDTLNNNEQNYTHLPLPCNIPVYYRIMATDGDFNSFSDSLILTPFDTIPPSAPEINYVSVIDHYSLEMEWELSDPKVLLYEIQLQTNAGNWVVIDTTGVTTQYTFTGLNTADSVYCIRIIAIDSCASNRSEPSLTHCAINLSGNPANLANELNWTNYVGFNPLLNYYVQIFENNNWLNLDTLNNNVLDYTHLTIPCNVPVHYRIMATDGNYISYSDSLMLTPFDTIPPDVPNLHFANVVNNDRIQLEWSVEPESDAKFFEIWRSSDGFNYNNINTLTYTFDYTDLSVNPVENTYNYYIIAIDSCDAGNRSELSDIHRSMKLNISTSACVPLVRLNWTAYQGFDTGSYIVERSTEGGAYNNIAVVSFSDTFYVDSTVLEDINYCFRIRAVDSTTMMFDAHSSFVCITPFVYSEPFTSVLNLSSVTQTGSNNGNIQLNWLAASPLDSFADGYLIYHAASDTTTGWSLIYDTDNLSDTVFVHTNINTSDSLNYYYVVIYNICDVEGLRSEIHRPVNLQAVNNNLNILLNWSAYIGFEVENYELYRSLDGRPYRLINITDTTNRSFNDSDILCDRSYAYKVLTIGINGEKSWSDTIAFIGYDTLPPETVEIRLASVTETGETEGSVNVIFKTATDANRNGYDIYHSFDGVNFTLVENIFPPAYDTFVSWTHNNINTITGTNSYYIISFDSCGNYAAPSDTHRVINLQGTENNNFNLLEWTSYVGWQSYTYIVERRRSTSNWQTIANLPQNINEYEDHDVRCDSNYLYRISAISIDTNIYSFSNIVELTAFSTDLPATPSLSRVTVTQTGIADGAVQIDWPEDTTGNVYYYNIERSVNSINWHSIATEIKINTFQDTNINTSQIEYFYRIETVDSCYNHSATHSLSHGSIVLKASPGEEQVTLNWNFYTGWNPSLYYIERDGIITDVVDNQTNTYTDKELICDQNYSFRVLAVLYQGVDSIWSYSNIDTITPHDTTPPIPVYVNRVTVSEPNEAVFIEWMESESHDVAYYELYRRQIGSYDYELLYTVTSQQVLNYTNQFDINNIRWCYMVKATDYCGNVSVPGNDACIIVPKVSNEKLVNRLNWDPYFFWDKPTERYNIYKSEDGNPYERIDVIPGRDSAVVWYDEDLGNFVEDYCYLVEAVEAECTFTTNCISSTSMSTEVCIKQDALVFIPNSFSPEISPDINDSFGPEGMFIRNYSMSIFNRWGQLIYETNISEDWDGKDQSGNFVPPGVYIYMMTIEGYNDDIQNVHGNVTIIR